jgi:hypothetical protein
MGRVGYVTTMWEQRYAYRILVGTNGGKAFLYLSQDVDQAAGSSQQSARSVSGCGQAAGSSQHGLSQDVDK